MIDFFRISLIISTCMALSGFYYDNGVDQTIVHKHLNKREKKEMQSEILHLLGLQHRPRPVLSSTSKFRRNPPDGPGDMSSAPRFLIDVYQSLMEEDSGDLKLVPDLIEREFNISNSDVNTMDQADIIMSFVNRGQHFRGIRHHHGDGRFWFDLSEVPQSTVVMSAEMRLYINRSVVQDDTSDEKNNSHHKFLDYPRLNPAQDSTLYEITLYEVGEDDSLLYVDRLEISHEQEGWIAFNVSLVLGHWLLRPEENFGLQLVCRSALSGHQVATREVGLVGSHGSGKLQPFMVAFFRAILPTASSRSSHLPGVSLDTSEEDVEEDDATSSVDNHRIRRQTPGSVRKRGKDSDEFGSWNPYTDLDARLSRRSCQKKNLYVSFRDLGWQDWIIAPDGYAAFYCNGECSFPLNAHMNASNHAIVQTLVHLMNPYRVPKPCCAPIKLSSISVLYFDDNSNVILKKYRNMVVKSCGCH